MADRDVSALSHKLASDDAWLEGRPKCSVCHEHIQDEHMYMFDGDAVCEDCLQTYCDRYVVSTERYTDEIFDY